jgi:2-polyprenyl-6-methoxyphenol hydroxylase-like FAD-dependent oxidoreductase
MGDAIHSFPPDLGQGVNAAVADVDALRQCLDAAGDDYGAALAQFEAQRVPESAALIRMMQVCPLMNMKQTALQHSVFSDPAVMHSTRMLMRKLCSR